MRIPVPSVGDPEVDRALKALVDGLDKREVFGNFAGTPADGDVLVYDGETKLWGPGRDTAPRELASFRDAGNDFVTGHPYYTSDVFAALTTVAPTADVIRAIPFVAPARGGKLDRIAINVTVASASTHARLGIYKAKSATNNYPGLLVAGSDVAALDTAATGLKSNVLNLSLEPGALYWLAHICDSALVTILATAAAGTNSILGCNPTSGVAYNAAFVAQTYGALPTVFPAGGSLAGSAAVAIFVRFSA